MFKGVGVRVRSRVRVRGDGERRDKEVLSRVFLIAFPF